MSQFDMLRHPKKRAFLAAYAETPTIRHAAEAAGVDRTLHYHWMHTDPVYVEAFRRAHEMAIESLEREARRRAIEGVDKPVYQGGRQVGTIREYSDTLLIFLLKGARPSVYRERIDISVDVRHEAERYAAALGLSADEVIAEAERILAEAGQ